MASKKKLGVEAARAKSAAGVASRTKFKGVAKSSNKQRDESMRAASKEFTATMSEKFKGTR